MYLNVVTVLAQQQLTEDQKFCFVLQLSDSN